MILCYGNCLVLSCSSFTFLIFFIVSVVENYDYDSDKLAPIILVNGMGASQIEGKWDTDNRPKFCDKKENDWEQMWLDPGVAFWTPHHLKCWAFRFQLLYDRSARKCKNQVGVKTRVKGRLGSLKASEFLTPGLISHQLPSSKYFHQMIEALKKSGYSSSRNLKAHSYDWRYAPPRQDDFNYYKRFTKLVEAVSEQTNRKVMIVGHSMGGLVTAHFLSNKTQEWKDKHIHAFLTVGTPWLGMIEAVGTYIVGLNLRIPTIDKKVTLSVQRTFQSLAFLLPEEEEFKDAVLVEWVSQNKSYTAKDYQQFFKDVKFEDGYLIREDVRPFFPFALDKLGVRFYCVWTNSSEIKTPASFRVTSSDISDTQEYEMVPGPGDGRIPLNSQRYCEKFRSENVTIRNFQGYEHVQIIQETIFHDYVMSVAKGAQQYL